MQMKRAILADALLVGLQGQTAFAQGGPETPPGKPLFTLHSGFWVNLHHFLYVLGRARNGSPDSPAASRKQSPPRTWMASMASRRRNARPGMTRSGTIGMAPPNGM
jgi:hypothetical protein